MSSYKDKGMVKPVSMLVEWTGVTYSEVGFLGFLGVADNLACRYEYRTNKSRPKCIHKGIHIPCFVSIPQLLIALSTPHFWLTSQSVTNLSCLCMQLLPFHELSMILQTTENN